jgi:unsaturated chondroitin disaccharide hydrolase
MNMMKLTFLFLASFSLISVVYGQDIKKVFSDAEKQTQVMLREINKVETSGDMVSKRPASFSPRTLSSDGKLLLVPAKDWTSGFFPGVLWSLYEFTGKEEWKKQAREYTSKIENEKWNAGTHDMGFKIYCSFGTGYRITKDTTYRSVIIQAAKTLSKRFYPKVGCLRSWDHSRDKWAFPVIIDNMMNLELLFAATDLTGDSSYYKIAVSHARTTMKNHFRPDYSSYHVVDYDSLTGNVIKRTTHQGYSNESAWARGQAWGLYGYTMCYRETKDKSFLVQAEKIARFILSNPNLPKDLVPYWDFNAPGIPNEPRDASAAAVMASAFYELSLYSKGNNYRNIADTILKNLSDKYRSPIGENKGFILTHSTGSKPMNNEVDVPLNYADYYYIEALLRSEKLKENKPLFGEESKDKTIRVFALDMEDLSATKHKIQNGDKQAGAVYRKLLAEADKILKNEPYTVMNKSQIPPSGDKHDYMSLAPYFWPNPSTPDGLPYIRKDGEHNPGTSKIKDKDEMLAMEKDVEKLSLAYYYSGDEKYANRAAFLIRTWFLLPATKMNPNVNFGQAVLGSKDGRGEGVLETRGFGKVIDAIGLMSESASWSANDQKDMQKWIEEFLSWMQTSPNGIAEMKAGNNHGVWYDAQELNYALFLEKKVLVHNICKNTLDRLDKEMEEDGSFPKELARTNSLGYSLFVMQAFFQIAILADNAGIDLWNAVTPSGKSFKKGVEFLLPYLKKEKEWSHKQIKPFNYNDAEPFMKLASKKY